MRCRLRIEVSLKRGHTDPEGETTRRLLKDLGYEVETVNITKTYYLIIEAKSREEAETLGEEMCKRFLANPTKDDYVIVVEEKK